MQSKYEEALQSYNHLDNENNQGKVPVPLPYYYGLYSPYKLANVVF